MLQARAQTRLFALLLPILGATCLILVEHRPLLPLANKAILINEIDAETPGTDTAEFVELYDGGAGNTSLDGLLLVFFSGHDDRSYRTIDLSGYQSSPDGFFLLANESVPGVDLTFPDNLLQNGADAVALYLGQPGDFPNGTAVMNTNLLDAIVYGANSPDDPGLLILLLPGEPQVDENSLDFAEFHSSQRCPDGAGGERRTTYYNQDLPTPKSPNNCPVVTDKAPQVEDTFPVANANDVAPDANISITFSEEVTVSGSWHSIVCSISGTHTTDVTGNGITFALDPATDFTYGENCSVTLFGDLINDVDTQDPPDQMAVDYSWSFNVTDPPVADHILINEIDADTPGTDTAEFIEIYDGGSGATNLDGLVIAFFNGSDDRSYRAVDLEGQFTDDQGYFIIGSSTVNNVGLTIPDGLIQNGADAIALYQGSGTDFPNGTAVTANGLLDAIVYDTDDADDAGLLKLHNPGQAQVNEASRANAAFDSSQRCPNGSGGQRNTTSYVQNLPTPGASNKCTFDNAPHVSATWPADGQLNISHDISLSVTFNEAVLAGANAFKLSCNASGSHSLTKSGGPIQFTLTPDTNLAAGERCTADVVAAEIGDQDSDDPPDHMAGDYTWSFTTKSLPIATQMLINEVDADTPGTDTAEFIELFDGGTGHTRLDGLLLVLFNGNGDVSYRNIDLDGYSTGPAGYFTAGGSELPSVDLVLPNAIIQNGADAVALYVADSSDFPAGSPITQSGLLDALVYDTNDDDDFGLLPLLNSSQPQINEAARNLQEYDSNQRCPNGQGGQRNSSGYLQNPATPGTANDCAVDTPPHVAATTPSAEEHDVPLDETLTVSFSEDVSVNEKWFEIRCSQSLVHSASQNGGPKMYTLDPQVNFESGELCLVTLFADQITDLDGLPQPMLVDYTWTFTTGTPQFGDCGDRTTPIHTIQGSALSSPMAGVEGVVIEGIVSAVFQGADGLEGFFLQEESADQDEHSLTSEGIFIHDSGLWDGVISGETMRVQGSVVEIEGQTSLSELIAMRSCGSGSAPAPSHITLPLPSLFDWENVEGMGITLQQDLSVTGSTELSSEGAVDLALHDRLYVPTELASPGAAAEFLANENNRSRIMLDDGSMQPAPSPPYLGEGNTLRIGDSISEVTGILAESESGYRIHPTESISVSRTNARPPAPTAPSTELLRIALFDTGDYFNGDGHGAGFSTNRGAASAEEFARQRAKIISALLAINADIIGLLSLENDGYEPDGALQDLVNGLNDRAPEGTIYAFVNPQVPKMGDNEIAVGLIYRSDKINPQGHASILDSSSFDQANVLPLIQAFTANETGESFILAITQLRSRDQCPPPGDPNGDQHDGQGCWNALRVKEANELASFLETIPSNNRDTDVLIIGNLNAYIYEDPPSALETAGFINLSKQFIERGYTSVENGESGTLLYAFASPTLTARVRKVQQWHINADEPALLDYKLTNPSSLYTSSPYRSAENDPLLIDLFITAEQYDIGKIFFPVLTTSTP